MATSNVLLPTASWRPDATNPPGLEFEDSIPRWLFDDSTAETMYAEFVMPSNFASTAELKIYYAMASATSGKIEFEVSVMAVSDGDSQDLDTESYDTANTTSVTVPGTAGYLDVVTVTLTNDDSLAASDLVRMRISRDADDATNDTATGDLEFHGACLSYTTS